MVGQVPSDDPVSTYVRLVSVPDVDGDVGDDVGDGEDAPGEDDVGDVGDDVGDDADAVGAAVVAPATDPPVTASPRATAAAVVSLRLRRRRWRRFGNGLGSDLPIRTGASCSWLLSIGDSLGR